MSTWHIISMDLFKMLTSTPVCSTAGQLQVMVYHFSFYPRCSQSNLSHACFCILPYMDYPFLFFLRTTGVQLKAVWGQGHFTITMKSKHRQLRRYVDVGFECLWSPTGRYTFNAFLKFVWGQLTFKSSIDSTNLSNLSGTCQTSFSFAAQWKFIIRQSINLHFWSPM